MSKNLLKNEIKILEKRVSDALKAKDSLQKYLKHNNDVAKIEEVVSGEVFFEVMKFYTAQRKAPAFERFLSHKFDWVRIPASEDRGDFLTEGGYIELKTSFSNEAMKLNLRQIRQWQDIDKYLCIFIDDKNNQKQSVVFELTKEEMQSEIEIMGGFTHGTKTINNQNEHNEYSITLSLAANNQHYQRWIKNYSNPKMLKQILSGVKSEFR